MKSLISLCTGLLMAAGCSQVSRDPGQTVNPVIGDKSFIAAYGSAPVSGTSEQLRVRTHLAYVSELLRYQHVPGLSAELQARRERMLDLLDVYRAAGEFPRNFECPGQRVPCFIDEEGRICAVGYLIEQTAGRAVAEEINRKYKYERLLAMNDPVVDDWIAGSGLTKVEAAMIQPSYGFTPVNNNYIKPEYGISSAVLSGINLSLAAMNSTQMISRSGSRAIPVVGLAAGIGQVVLGAASFPEEQQQGWYGTTSNESQKVLSMVNIGLGTTSIILSTWNLLTNRAPKERRTTWNVYGFPTRGNNTGIALSLTRRF